MLQRVEESSVWKTICAPDLFELSEGNVRAKSIENSAKIEINGSIAEPDWYISWQISAYHSYICDIYDVGYTLQEENLFFRDYDREKKMLDLFKMIKFQAGMQMLRNFFNQKSDAFGWSMLH